MMVPSWVIGLLFVVLVAAQLLWAADLIASAIRLHRGWGLPRSGSFWLGVHLLASAVLNGWFAVVLLRDPGRARSLLIMALILLIAVPAALAWYWLRHEATEEPP